MGKSKTSKAKKIFGAAEASDGEVAGNRRTVYQSPDGSSSSSPEVDRLVEEVIARVADKWTMLVLEALAQHGTVRFSRLAEIVEGISQKMLTQTLRQMEADGFVTRKVYPVIPPRVEYTLAPLGSSLGDAFCGVWHWAENHYKEVAKNRAQHQKRMAERNAQ
jgi:DNA-binding HxlR family transcriptional regulator